MTPRSHTCLAGASLHVLLAVLLAVTAVETALLVRVLARRPASPAVPAATLAAPAVEDAGAPVSPQPVDDDRGTIDVFRSASRAVVSVANKALVRDFFGLQVYEVPQGAGSGFVWDKDGHIVSNFHVVYNAAALTVTFPDGSAHEARVVGADPDHDLAVLRIESPPETLEPLAIGRSRDLQVGQRTLAIGNPFGLDTSLSVGVVSALGRTITSMTDRRIYDVIQTDAAINPGNSGGPLLDSAGRLIGVNTAILSPSGAYAGIGFAVPVDTVRRVVPELIAHGRVRRAGLGVQLLPDRFCESAGVAGAAVLRTVPGGPAENVGIAGVVQTREGRIVLGDVIVEVDGKPVRNNEDLTAILDRHEAGDTVKVVTLRNGQRRQAQVRLQALE